MAVTSTTAACLHEGDEVANLGRVMATTTIGVFVVAKIRRHVWSLVTGTLRLDLIDVTWHKADIVELVDA